MSTRQTARADRLPRLLSEQPAYEDRLGVHERIAEQLRWIIEEITRNGGETKKNVVALFGTWGSGKSTVINLLEKKVRDTHKVIRYDSWSHRDEHLKKAFLLHLLDQLHLNDIPYMRKRKNEITLRDAVTGRVREQTITREPMPISITIYLFGVLFLLGSLSISLLGILKLLHFNTPLPGWSIITIVFSYLLLSVALFFRKDDIAGRILLLKTPISISEAITSFGEMEIPSIQFQEFFREILKRWKEKEDRPLIIVLDNLDRVDDETVSRFFSLIQSALDALGLPESQSSSPNGGLQEQVVFVVPIDKTRVHQVLGKMIHTSGAYETHGRRGAPSSGDEGQRADKTHGGRETTSFQEDFLKKLFPYAVEVPELVASNWRKFFQEKLLEAFPWMDVASAEAGLVVGIFQRGMQTVQRSITPREIIHFLNEVVLHAWVYRELFHKNLEQADVVMVALYTAIVRYDRQWREELFENRVKVPSESKDGEVQEHQESAESCPLLHAMISPYVGIIIPENYKERLLQLHYKTENIWDLLLVDPILDITSEGGDRAEEILEDEIEPKLNVLSPGRKKEVVEEVIRLVLNEYPDSLSASPARIGRFVWFAAQMESDYAVAEGRVRAFLHRSLEKKEALWLDLDLNAASGLLQLLRGFSPDTLDEVQRKVARSLLRTLDVIGNLQEEF